MLRSRVPWRHGWNPWTRTAWKSHWRSRAGCPSDILRKWTRYWRLSRLVGQTWQPHVLVDATSGAIFRGLRLIHVLQTWWQGSHTLRRSCEESWVTMTITANDSAAPLQRLEALWPAGREGGDGPAGDPQRR